MQTEPTKEHDWLQRLVGQWSGECECTMGPDQPVAKTRGTEVVRPLGGLWTVAQGEGECPMTHSIVHSIMTLGYDPQRGRFIGTFVASMMTHLWVYEGSLDQTGTKLILETEGPNFSPGASGLARYRDTLEFIDDDHRTMTSAILGEDGQWHQFMVGNYERKKARTGPTQRSRKREVHAADL